MTFESFLPDLIGSDLASGDYSLEFSLLMLLLSRPPSSLLDVVVALSVQTSSKSSPCFGLNIPLGALFLLS